MIELGDSKSHPADWVAIQGPASRAIDFVGQNVPEKLGISPPKGQSKLFINKVVKLLGPFLAWAIGVRDVLGA